MSTETVSLPDFSPTDVSSAVVAAVLGSIAFGIVMSLTMGEVLLTAIPGMYGLEHISRTLAIFVGWAIHISHAIAVSVPFLLLRENISTAARCRDRSYTPFWRRR